MRITDIVGMQEPLEGENEFFTLNIEPINLDDVDPLYNSNKTNETKTIRMMKDSTQLLTLAEACIKQETLWWYRQQKESMLKSIGPISFSQSVEVTNALRDNLKYRPKTE